jgi:hypothetical protein
MVDFVFEVLIFVAMKNSASWLATPCSLDETSSSYLLCCLPLLLSLLAFA